MPRLTLSFKEKRLKIYPLTEEELQVGRDPVCHVHIDSLAVEPLHARIRRQGKAYHLVPAEGIAGLTVNHKTIDGEYQLQDGDLIQIGKHTLTYAQETAADDATPISNRRAPITGWMQIMSGSHLGRTIRLDRAMTRLGKSETQTAMVARRNDGYYLSHLQGEDSPQVNDQSIGERTHRLRHGENVRIGDLELQFFLDEADGGQSTKTDQRQFSRVPFDASATLTNSQHHWETELLDLSLKGALVRRPVDWSGFVGNDYRLHVHLAEDVEVDMDVTVAHVEDDRVGLTCRDIDVDSVTHLRRLLELNLGNADLLDRELAALG